MRVSQALKTRPLWRPACSPDSSLQGNSRPLTLHVRCPRVDVDSWHGTTRRLAPLKIQGCGLQLRQRACAFLEWPVTSWPFISQGGTALVRHEATSLPTHPPSAATCAHAFAPDKERIYELTVPTAPIRVSLTRPQYHV
jgi:hypothetical protein